MPTDIVNASIVPAPNVPQQQNFHSDQFNGVAPSINSSGELPNPPDIHYEMKESIVLVEPIKIR